MQFTTEDLSPVKKKITITVPAEEADAALASAIALYRTSVNVDGFRKGKVPASIIESRFRDQIYSEATTDLVNVHINEIITENSFFPVSRIDFGGGQIERGKDFVYFISFDVMPEVALPDFAAESVDQEEAVVDENEVSGVIDRLRQNLSKTETVTEKRTPKEGDIAVLDFAAYDEDGKAVDGIAAENFNLPIGEGQTLEDFENLVKTLNAGEKGEGPVTFPADFFNPEFAGKTLTMKATLREIKERILPELDDEFAKKTGNMESLDKLKESIRDSYMKSKTDLHKSSAQKALLDNLLAKTDFPLPDSMVESHVNILLDDFQDKLERQGKGLEALGKTREALAEEVRPEAEQRTRMQVLLLSTARAKELSVSEQEVDTHLHRLALQNKVDFDTIKDYYTKNNMLFALRDRLLCDKAMDFIYDEATINTVPAGSLDKNEQKTAKKSATKKGPRKKAEDAPEGSDETEE